MEMGSGGGGASFRFLSDAGSGLGEASTVRDTGQVGGGGDMAIEAMPLSVAAPMDGSGGGWASMVMDGIISVAKEGGAATESSSSSDTAIGLELGKRTYFEAAAGGSSSNSSSATATHVPTPPKRPRLAGQSPTCQVEGCKTDLSSAKEYHRRHKVCAVHSKASRVIVSGQEQRFCQQCSRFHGLSEFDEGKRSCRRRLAGHNERRRKPQPDPLGLNSVARFLPPPFHHQGTHTYTHPIANSCTHFSQSISFSFASPSFSLAMDSFSPSSSSSLSPNTVFTDTRKLGHHHHLCATERPSFLSHPRISSALWDEYSAQKIGWSQRILDQSTLDSMAMAAGSERQQQQLFLTGLQHQQSSSNNNSSSSDTNNRSPSPFPPQSPKGMIPVVVSAETHTHQYFHHHHNQGSVDPLRHHRISSVGSLAASATTMTTSSSSSGAGVVLSGLEAIPIIGQGFARVSDSGRALSLQSNIQQQLPSSSAAAALAVSSLDVTTAHHHHHHSLMPDQNLQHGSHIPIAQPLAQAAHQHHNQHHLHQFEWMGDKLFPASTLHPSLPSSAGFSADSTSNTMNPSKGQMIQRPSFVPSGSMNSVGGYECLPLYSMLQGGEVGLGGMTQDAKTTIDLMHNNHQQDQGGATAAASQSLVSSGVVAYEMGMNAYGELQALRSFDSASSSIFSSQQQM